MKLLQQRDLSAAARLAARLRLSEKRILQSTLDAVRRCSLTIAQALKTSPVLEYTEASCFVTGPAAHTSVHMDTCHWCIKAIMHA